MDSVPIPPAPDQPALFGWTNATWVVIGTSAGKVLLAAIAFATLWFKVEHGIDVSKENGVKVEAVNKRLGEVHDRMDAQEKRGCIIQTGKK